MAPFGFTPKARHNRGVALRSTYRLDGWVMGPVDKEGWGLSYVFAQPSVLAAAATDLAGIGSAINQATAAVAAPTTGLAAAAADEVSTALATLFGAYGQQFQAISAQVAAFHNEFTQRLAAAANAFVNAEATNTSALVQEATAGLFKPTSPPVLPPMFNQNTAIIMGGTGSPIPTPSYVNAITTLFIDPVVSNPVVKALVTPEELYPITGVKSLPFQTSVQLGLQILDGAIWEQINAGNHVTVFGYSQSAVIASLEMQHLISLGPNAPSPSQLNFILIGNEMNPNGGILARIPGLNVTTLGLPFYGATPDNPYPTTTYTLEYDGFADFPRYPLNVLSDINAVFGILTVHTTYADLTPAQIASATQLPTQGTTSNTYYIIETEHLPLLAPLRAIPVIGPPLAALVEPNLEVIVNLGYGDPRFGYSTSPANVPTPFGLFPDVPASVVADAPARHPRSGGAGEDGGQRLDHRLGRFRRPRRPDRADLGRLLLTADPPAEPVQRRRPDRGSAGYRRRHRRHLRCATGRSGVGRLDPLPRRLRLPQPAAGFHRLGNRLRRARRLLGLRPAVRLHRRRVSLRKGVATTVVRGDRADRSRRRLLVCPSLSRVGGNYAPAARGARCSNRRSADCWSGC